jgi:hypothetical protein
VPSLPAIYLKYLNPLRSPDSDFGISLNAELNNVNPSLNFIPRKATVL